MRESYRVDGIDGGWGPRSVVNGSVSACRNGFVADMTADVSIEFIDDTHRYGTLLL